jgi:hypothetical protein
VSSTGTPSTTTSSRYIDEMLRSIDMIVMGRVTGRRSAPMSRLGGITADTTPLHKST